MSGVCSVPRIVPTRRLTQPQTADRPEEAGKNKHIKLVTVIVDCYFYFASSLFFLDLRPLIHHPSELTRERAEQTDWPPDQGWERCRERQRQFFAFFCNGVG